MFRPRSTLRIVALAVSISFLARTPALATIHEINSVSDAGDSDTADGTCDTGGTVLIEGVPETECSFRAALEQSETFDDIRFGSVPFDPDGRVVLKPQTPYPAITADGVEIFDSYNSLAFPTPVFVLDGSDLTSGSGLRVVGAADVGIHAVAIIRFPEHGIELDGVSDTHVTGCHIGIEFGELSAGNGGDGIHVTGSSTNTTVGHECNFSYTSCQGPGNVISGNSGSGIVFADGISYVRRNRIGTNVGGTSAVPNLEYGIDLVGGFARIGGASGQTISQVDENVVSGNGLGGMRIAGQTYAYRNLIGTDASGTTPIPNSGPGIRIEGNQSKLINEIAFNSGPGIEIASGQRNELLGDGQPNANALTIHDNAGPGVHVTGGDLNFVLADGFANNGGLAIDLGPLGRTPNDPQDLDEGPNRLQNMAVLDTQRTGYDPIGGTLFVTADVDTADTQATYPIRVDFYAEDPSNDALVRLGTGVQPFAYSRLYASINVEPGLLASGDDIRWVTSEMFGSSSEISDPFQIPEPNRNLGVLAGLGFLLALRGWRPGSSRRTRP